MRKMSADYERGFIDGRFHQASFSEDKAANNVEQDESRRAISRDDIIAMVQEVIVLNSNRNPFDFRLTNIEQIEHFATLVAAAEREACTKLCEQMAWECDDIRRAALEVAAERIRARGNATALLEEEN